MNTQKPIKTGDDLLTMLAGTQRDMWITALGARGIKVLREAADLCGVGDTDTMGRKALILAIIDNF